MYIFYQLIDGVIQTLTFFFLQLELIVLLWFCVHFKTSRIILYVHEICHKYLQL